VAWTTWITLMGSVGLTVLALAVAGPAARRTAPAALARLTSRVALTAAALGILAVPAVLSDLAYGASQSGGYDYAAAWDSLYDGSSAGLLSGIEVSCSLAAAALLAVLASRPVAAGRARPWMLSGALAAAAVALGTTKFPTDVSDGWGRTVFETGVWMLHLGGGAIWLGGLAGLLLLALPGGVAEVTRGAFWATVIRRFSAVAMGSVAVIALSGLFLYWEHVDGPEQLLTTMYGRVLGVKILIFGTLLLLGMANQFWLHPRIEALRAAGDQRPLRAILTRRFPVLVTAELLLVMTVLFVAPFLHGSARNQAFQDNAAAHATSATAELPKIPAKQVSASTWAWGATETAVVIAVMIAGYGVSGRIARARTAAAATTVASRDPDDLVGA
jgi:putative copper export protein